MKKLITVIFIILIFLPMFLYLNPFSWIKRNPHYEPSQKTTNLLYKLNKKYKVKMEVGDATDTLWYFRDLKNNKISKLENFGLRLYKDSFNNSDRENVKNYLNDFRTHFEHKKYFDSINVELNFDSIIYKTPMK
ncbi:hypothetical protein [Kaistella sp.]|uniref:hypothetical protein n=1 Tax=Kaistella sp. TaxID=2782235 RepID=UPI003C3A9E10